MDLSVRLGGAGSGLGRRGNWRDGRDNLPCSGAKERRFMAAEQVTAVLDFVAQSLRADPIPTGAYLL